MSREIVGQFGPWKIAVRERSTYGFAGEVIVDAEVWQSSQSFLRARMVILPERCKSCSEEMLVEEVVLVIARRREIQDMIESLRLNPVITQGAQTACDIAVEEWIKHVGKDHHDTLSEHYKRFCADNGHHELKHFKVSIKARLEKRRSGNSYHWWTV